MPLQPREEAIVNRLYNQLVNVPEASVLGSSLKCIIKYVMILSRGKRAAINAFLQQQKLALQIYLLGKLKIRQVRFENLKKKMQLTVTGLSAKLHVGNPVINAIKMAGNMLGDPTCQPALEGFIGAIVKKQVNIPEFDVSFQTLQGTVTAANFELAQLERAADVNNYIERSIKATINTLDAYLTVLDAVDAALAIND